MATSAEAGDPELSIPAARGGERRRRLLSLAYLVILVAACLHFVRLHFLLNVEHTAQASIEALMAFEADLPYQYRVLVPALLGAVPDGLLESLRERLMAFEFLATVCTVLAFRQWLRRFFAGATLCSLLSLLIVPCLLYTFVLPREAPLWFAWDIPSVLFFTLGLLWLHERRWGWFYPLFVVATLNRETSCFLTVIFALAYHDQARTRGFWVHLGAQLALWLLIKAGLYVAFQDNGGRFVYHHVQHNLEILATPTRWPTLLGSLGFTGVITVLGYPYLEDRFVRRAVWSLVPFGVGMFFVGRIIETRIYGELIPLTLCATLLIVSRVAREDGARVGHSPPRSLSRMRFLRRLRGTGTDHAVH